MVAHDGNTQPPLFRAALTSSTFLPSQYAYNDPIPEVRLFRLYLFRLYLIVAFFSSNFSARLSSNPGKLILAMAFYRHLAYFRCASAKNAFSCLQSVDLNTLETVNFNIAASGFFGTFVFVPVVDGSFIVERPIQTLQEGKSNGVRLFGSPTRMWLTELHRNSCSP